MARGAWPTAYDLESTLRGAGVVTTSPDDDQLAGMQSAIDASIREFQRRTGRVPFLGTAQTRYYDPPGPRDRVGHYGTKGGARRLQLDNGLVSLTSLTVTGDARTVNSDFWLLPENAAANEEPYESIEFYVPAWGLPRSIVVVGVWGWATTIPDDVWVAVCHYASATLMPMFAAERSGGMIQFSEAGAQEMYGVDPFGKSQAAWRTQYDGAISRYKRMRMG